MPLDHVAIVGASLAGLRTAMALRRREFAGRITMIGAEDRPPYDRPPLSKQLLTGEWEPDKARLIAPERLDALELDLRLGTRAVDLDVAHRTIGLHGGEQVACDAVVVATGAGPRLLPGTPDLEGIHVLRTLDDSLSLREAFAGSPRVTVVGAGFIGAEVAASARRRGLSVTLLEALPEPLSRGLGPRMGRVLGDIHTDAGVDLRCGVTVARFEGDARVERVHLSDGTVVETDLVVVGIGVTPTTAWLDGSGLELRDGVVCDAALQAAPGVFAAGDVARWPNPVFDEEMRVEHWTNASEQAEAVATNLLAGPDALTPFASVPWVWSDQYEHRIQVVGRPGPADDVEVVFGTVEERKFLALYGRGGRLVGALSMDCPRQLAPYLRLLQTAPVFDEAVASARAAG